MANIVHLLIFFFLLILASHHVIQGAAKSSRTSFIVPPRRESHLQGGGGGGKRWVDKNPRRLGLNPNPKNLHLSLPWSLNGGGKPREVSQWSTGSLENPRRLELDNPNSKNSHLFVPWSLNRVGKLQDVSQRFAGSLENPRRLGLDPNPKKNPRRMMIGSVAPTCTYNECKGCKYKCRAEQVPVEGNDPINSPYHYKCVCHR